MAKKIRITKCSSKDYWYKNKIGEEFIITNRAHKYGHRVMEGEIFIGVVRFSDCVEVGGNIEYKMSINEMKKEMLKYKDMFGGQLLEVDKVNECTTREELYEIIDNHNNHMEMMLNDAQSSLERFRKRIGLNII